MSANKLKLNMPLTYKGKYGWWRIINLVIMGILVGGALLTYIFIYQNIYSTISNTYVITQLNSSINWNTLDLQNYEKAQNIIRQKTVIGPLPERIRNIFHYATTPTSTITNTTTQG